MNVYLDGTILPASEARVSVDDRGFLFADGIYEVVRLYRGHPFRWRDHVERLQEGLSALRIAPPKVLQEDGLPELLRRLQAVNAMEDAEASLYLQITRGTAPRSHAFPSPPVRPTVLVRLSRLDPPPTTAWKEGATAVTVPDVRWHRCSVKTLALLPNVLAHQEARDAGAFEGLFRDDDGRIHEGTHTNFFLVVDGSLVTAPPGPRVLPGVTRTVILEIAEELASRSAGRPRGKRSWRTRPRRS